MIDKFNQFDDYITSFMKNYGIIFLRISVGVVFIWFGVLKFFPDLSPAQGLATATIKKLTFGLIQNNVALIMLALWETIIGIGLVSGKYLRITLFLLFTQMIGTLTPLVLFPMETFTHFPVVPTLEGQYIIKNLILISAGMVVGTTVQKPTD